MITFGVQNMSLPSKLRELFEKKCI
jgi:hypothetical protein